MYKYFIRSKIVLKSYLIYNFHPHFCTVMTYIHCFLKVKIESWVSFLNLDVNLFYYYLLIPNSLSFCSLSKFSLYI